MGLTLVDTNDLQRDGSSETNGVLQCAWTGRGLRPKLLAVLCQMQVAQLHVKIAQAILGTAEQASASRCPDGGGGPSPCVGVEQTDQHDALLKQNATEVSHTWPVKMRRAGTLERSSLTRAPFDVDNPPSSCTDASFRRPSPLSQHTRPTNSPGACT